MPNIKAAVKWVRQSERRTVRNRDLKTRLKTLFKKARLSGDPEFAAGVESQLDKAAGKGVIHRNKAARKKSRLARAVNAARNASATAATGSGKAAKATSKGPAARKRSKT